MVDWYSAEGSLRGHDLLREQAAGQREKTEDTDRDFTKEPNEQ